jgi:hypothetical protein
MDDLVLLFCCCLCLESCDEHTSYTKINENENENDDLKYNNHIKRE